jgi:glycosyltransferase
MKISIITATYNSSATIKACMDSVLNQTYKDIEYLIIDGNSKDGTLELIKSQAEKHHNITWVSEKDKGIYDALNKGIEKATGDVIGFVHSDDFLADNTIIDKIVKVFESKKVDGVYGNLHYVKFNKIDTVVRYWRSKPFRRKLLNRGWMPAHPTLFLKQEIYKSKGSFNLDYRIAADYDFILRIFNQSTYNFYFLPETIMKMRLGGTSNRSFKNLIQKTKEDYRVARTNRIKWPMVTVGLKNFSKIPQWLFK